MLLSLDCHARLEYHIIICHITRRGDTCYHVCATWVPQIIGAVPGIQYGESRVTTEGVYSPNVAMSIVFLADLGSKFGKYLILSMKIRAILAMKSCIVKTFVELKLDFVCEGIIPSRCLKLTAPMYAVLGFDTKSHIDFVCSEHKSCVHCRRNFDV